jgi:hypothetical protein
MEPVLCSQCLDAFDRALNSPIGQAFQSQFSYNFPSVDPSLDILAVRQTLLDRRYSSVSDYFTALDAAVNNCARFLGPETDLSLALLSVFRQIHRYSTALSPGDDAAWRSGLSSFAADVSSFISDVPDCRDDFREWTRPPPPAQVPREMQFVATPPNTSHIDMYQLKAMLHRLTSDEDHQEVVSIIQRYEPEFAAASGTVELDIKKCRPDTLVRLYDFAVKRAPPPPPKQDTPLKRTASMPMVSSGPRLQKPHVMFNAPVTNPLPDTSPFLAILGSPLPSPSGSPAAFGGPRFRAPLPLPVGAGEGSVRMLAPPPVEKDRPFIPISVLGADQPPHPPDQEK